MTTAAQAKTRLFRIKFIHLVRKGLTAREIAEKLGVTLCSVRDRGKRYGMKFARPVKAALPFGVKPGDMDELGAEEPVQFEEESRA